MQRACVIVGASHAAAQLAPVLRRSGWEGRIVVVGDEPCLPYHRPPLSKTYLSGEKSFHDIVIRPQAAFEKADVHLTLGVRATAIDRARHLLELDNGEALHYDKLALTVGARPRLLPVPGADLEGVFCLRNLVDADNIRRFFGHGRHAVVIGGGYIGLETAASLRHAGMEVTVLESLPRVLARVTAEPVSAFFERVHREEGVRLLVGAGVARIEGDSAVRRVVLGDGSVLPADVVIVGIGVVPNVELAAAAGLAVDNGIVVDEFARTTDPDIVAAGDCTSHFNPIYARQVRLESVQNANEQSSTAANTLCGKLEPYNALPWFWSDQYDIKLQIAGLSQGHDRVIIRGDIAQGRRFAAFYLREGRIIAIDAVNSPQEFMLGKRVITNALEVDLDRLEDVSVPFKDLIRG
jgi:3-phenylpropionate/trans-cinnamate dioxygenase ferredoxin reductase subunit